MDLRLKDLTAIDPQAVPLPHGTEVITRVDKVLGERRLPQGSIGRVVAVDGDQVDVLVVGQGTARYQRGVLTPRRAGQGRWAMRRFAAWEALRRCAVLEATVGSRAWGLADAGSDTDLRGAYLLPLPWTTGLGDPPLDLVSVDGSATYWEVGKMVRQALRADPNTLELLFVGSVRALDPVGEWILEARDAFVSTEIYGSFGRYALSQLKRLLQSMRLAEHRAVVLEWLREDPTPSLDEVARRLAAAAPRDGVAPADAELTAKGYVKQLYRSLHDQGLCAHADFASMVELARRGDAAFDLPRELRPKNAYNLVRLVATAVHWLRTGTAELEVRGALRDQLLAIKRGDVSLDETMRAAEALTPELDEARRASPLPARPDVARADALMRRVGAEVARRWVEQAPGPWGRDAPAPPPIAWDEGGDEDGTEATR
jgi:hypothetical protein